MKRYLIAVSFFLAVGCRQCSSQAMGTLNPLVTLPPRIFGSSVYLSKSALDSPPVQEFVNPSVMDLLKFDQSPTIFTQTARQQFPKPDIAMITDGAIDTRLTNIYDFTIGQLRLPIKIIKFFLFPFILLFKGIQFCVKLFFLPVTIGWKILKLLLYPIIYLFQTPTARPMPPFDYGVPKPSSSLHTLVKPNFVF